MVGSSRFNAINNMVQRNGHEALYYQAVPCEISYYIGINEIRTFSSDNLLILKGEESITGATVEWAYTQATVSSGAVSITNLSSSVQYVEDLDFYVNRKLGTITRNSTGAIPASQQISITYDWETHCLDEVSGYPRQDCPQCGGIGVIYSNSVPVTGLFHIPQYDASLMQAGFIQVGDVYFTVLAEDAYKMWGAMPRGIDNQFVRDKFVIADEVWLVMASPSTIQIQHEIIGYKFLLRRLKES